MTGQSQDKAPRILASGGALGALLASSCCIAPLALLSLGIGGAWIGNLTVLEPHKWAFISVALVCLGLGFWTVYFRETSPCRDGSYCARPKSSLIVKSALWLAAALVAASATADWWAPQFY